MSTVFVNGTFDILHLGHLHLLAHAKTLGDYVVVGIDTDKRVAELKGPDRPVFSQAERKYMLLALRYVDIVAYFGSDEELEQLVEACAPDIMVVGSDWKDKNVIGSQYAKELRFFDRIDGFSTTGILQRLTDR